MSLAKTVAVCPFCKEPIHPAATRCKHCQSDLAVLQKTRKRPLAKFNTFRFGFLTGIVFTVALFVLVYIQFFRK